MLLAACAGRPGPTDPLLSDRKLNLEEFFDGRTVAHGQFQDVFGTVRRRFVVTIDGDWDGRTLTLDENFVYEDGSTENRNWTLTKTGPDTWTGTRPRRDRHGHGRRAGRHLQLAIPHRPAGARRHPARGVRRLDVAADRGPPDEHRLHAPGGCEIGQVVIFFEKDLI